MRDLKELQEKIQNKIDSLAKEVEEKGFVNFGLSQNDFELFYFRHEIIDTLSNRGYNVSETPLLKPNFHNSYSIRKRFEFK